MNPFRVESPCKDCPDRFVGCHAKCVKYIDFQQELSVKTREYHNGKAKANATDYTNYIVDRHRDRNRKKHRGYT